MLGIVSQRNATSSIVTPAIVPTPATPLRTTTSTTTNSASVTCHICKQKGYYATTCPQKDPNYYKKNTTPSAKRILSTIVSDMDSEIPLVSKTIVQNSLSVENPISPLLGSTSMEIHSDVTGKVSPEFTTAVSARKSYGIHTLCLINGKEIVAFVYGGAQTSFISLSFVKENNLSIIPQPGKLTQAFSGSTVNRIGIVEDIILENGKHCITTSLEVADLADEEILIIGFNLFVKLSYSIQGVPVFWPQLMSVSTVLDKEVDSTLIPELPASVDEIGIAIEWKKVILDNQSIPKNSVCQLPGSTLSIETTGDPVWVRQYPNSTRTS